MERQFVSFYITGIKYCLDIMDVEEVVRETKFTKMPDMPSFIEGIMNLRGIVVPVMSVKKKLGLDKSDEIMPVSHTNHEVPAVNNTSEPPADGKTESPGGNNADSKAGEKPLESTNAKIAEIMRAKKKSAARKMIIVRIEGVLVGFLVDNLDRVFAIDEKMIQSAEGVSTNVDRAFIEGVAKIGEEVFIILNVKKMIGFDEKTFIKEEIME
jgi:purine-binding chemotaxis protein CheW